MKNDNNKLKNQYRVNEQIRVREVRIVGDEGATVMSTRDALDLARQQGVDLVEISPNAQPPVCRIIDYSKFLYQQKSVSVHRQMSMTTLSNSSMPRSFLRMATKYVHTYSSVVVQFFSRNKVKFSSFVLQTTLRSSVR